MQFKRDKAKRKADKGADTLDRFLKQNPIPVIKGPDGLFMIDVSMRHGAQQATAASSATSLYSVSLLQDMGKAVLLFCQALVDN